jgi:hypothetical protein
MRDHDYKMAAQLDRDGVPRPDGTAVGNLRHVLKLYENAPDDRQVLHGTRGVYGYATELTLGDLRALLALVDAPKDGA